MHLSRPLSVVKYTRKHFRFHSTSGFPNTRHVLVGKVTQKTGTECIFNLLWGDDSCQYFARVHIFLCTLNLHVHRYCQTSNLWSGKDFFLLLMWGYITPIFPSDTINLLQNVWITSLRERVNKIQLNPKWESKFTMEVNKMPSCNSFSLFPASERNVYRRVSRHAFSPIKMLLFFNGLHQVNIRSGGNPYLPTSINAVDGKNILWKGKLMISKNSETHRSNELAPASCNGTFGWMCFRHRHFNLEQRYIFFCNMDD